MEKIKVVTIHFPECKINRIFVTAFRNVQCIFSAFLKFEASILYTENEN